VGAGFRCSGVVAGEAEDAVPSGGDELAGRGEQA
jgi:hypothetical protein